MMGTNALVERSPTGRFIDVSAPAYSVDGRYALVYVRGFNLVSPEGWTRIQVFGRGEGVWTPIDCGLRIIA